MKILVTGITGALGGAIADGLRGHDVVGLTRREHSAYPTVIPDAELLRPPLRCPRSGGP